MTRVTRAFANAWVAAGLFALATIAATWPLAAHLTTDIAADVGDPVFNTWVLMWTGGQVLRFLSGDWHALANYWNGNIFYPEPLTLAYSEHLTPQMLQILPIFAATGNIVLCYNLLFLAAIALSGLGMYLFVREITGQPVAGIVAGMAFAFAPYRADQFPHLQVITTQWMPLALYGVVRYFATGRPRALAGATAAAVAQALSCGYYLFFFTPVFGAFLLAEGVRQGAWRHRRTWLQVAVAGVAALLVLWPFVTPYMAVRDANGGFGHRSADEVRYFSADTWALGTAPGILPVWRDLKAYERPEGSGFPGLTILVAAAAGVAVVVGAASRRSRKGLRPAPPPWRRIAAAVLTLAAAALAAAWVWLLVFQGGIIREWWGRITVRHFSDIGWFTLGVAALALALLPGARRFARGWFTSRGGFIVLAWLFAIAMTWGPVVYVEGKEVGTGPYALFFHYVPGFDGLRVPARFLMIVTLFSAALAGIGAAAVLRRQRTLGLALSAVLACGMYYEGRAVPFNMSRTLWVPHYEYVETTFPTPPNLGAVYDTIAALPDGAVIAELPFGSEPFETRWMYFAGYHRKPLVNGFSGFFPQSYLEMKSYLENDPLDKAAAYQAMLRAGVTHVVVHEQPWPENKGPMIESWITSSGGREVAVAGRDRLYQIQEIRIK